MDMVSLCGTSVIPSKLVFHSSYPRELKVQPAKAKATFTTSASKPGGFSFNPLAKKCEKCAGQGGIECPGCKGTGRNKKNGNIFERWKCYDCQGFGMKSCPECGKGGLTPEQRGER
ncbi:hypothetical protein AQUCO_01400107v1 [Aquilegia coerulea]|uniref:CR-type domain-containing protein n=1 Tax=Aquilegia coerulea TaxID=218851 RepID=A0A2G5DUK2_AQUCA|nr:hypothetical protein AQUCO_01400107v1 [Aquilegia coerulea]